MFKSLVEKLLMKTAALVTLAALLLLATAGSAAAHKTAYSPDGKIKIVWGFLNEPAVTYTKTGLDLILSDNATGAPIDGVSSSTLQVEMHFGDSEMQFKDFGAQFGTHGRYTGVITPTQAGVYTLHLTGTINGSDMGPDGIEIPGAHPVEDIKDTYFPAVNATDNAALAAKVDALQAKVDALSAKLTTQASTPATMTPQVSTPAKGIPAPAAVAALGVLAIAALVIARRK